VLDATIRVPIPEHHLDATLDRFYAAQVAVVPPDDWAMRNWTVNADGHRYDFESFRLRRGMALAVRDTLARSCSRAWRFVVWEVDADLEWVEFRGRRTHLVAITPGLLAAALDDADWIGILAHHLRQDPTRPHWASGAPARGDPRHGPGDRN
jgi:hypothetical protein